MINIVLGHESCHSGYNVIQPCTNCICLILNCLHTRAPMSHCKPRSEARASGNTPA